MRAFIINPSETLLDILKSLCSELYFTTLNNGFFRLFSTRDSSELLCLHLPYDRSARFLLVHIMYLIAFFKIARRVGVIMLSQISDYPLLTMFIGKIMNKKIVDFIGGSRVFLAQTVLHAKTFFLRKITSIYAIISLKVDLSISDKIILISNSLMSQRIFSKYKDKVRVAWNFPSKKLYDEFKVKKVYDDRDFVVGYVGAFTLAKGVYNLALAVKELIKNVHGIKVIFVGDYQSSEPPYLGLKIKQMLEDCSNVIFAGRVPHEKVSDYMNEMALLVLPSYSEGLPHVILEAMACGTPVLATSVGAIPDIIRDGETGFLLKSNDPKHIAEKIMELLKKPNLLRKVSINAYNYVRENFSYERTLETWRKVLSEL